MNIVVRLLSDTYDCETCGPSYADGAKVEFDDGTTLELSPTAHCFGGDNYSETAIYTAILKHLGHTVVVDDGEF